MQEPYNLASDMVRLITTDIQMIVKWYGVDIL